MIFVSVMYGHFLFIIITDHLQYHYCITGIRLITSLKLTMVNSGVQYLYSCTNIMLVVNYG